MRMNLEFHWDDRKLFEIWIDDKRFVEFAVVT